MENTMNTNKATENAEVNTNTEKENTMERIENTEIEVMGTVEVEPTENVETAVIVDITSYKEETTETEPMAESTEEPTEMTDAEVLEVIKEEMHYDFDNLERYDKRSLPWSVKQLVSAIKKGTATFDNTVQRTLVWDKEKKSRLIHTAILNLPCPPLYANVYTNEETRKKTYDFLDGKQRSNAFKEYLEDCFTLTGVPALVFSDGKEFDINGYLFSELPEEVQDMIKNYSLNISTMEDLDEDEVADLFYILNNGVSLTKIEISRVKAKSLDNIRKVANHPLFDVCLTARAKAKYYNEDITVKGFALLFHETESLENKEIRPYMERMELSQKDIDGMNNLFNIMLDIYRTEMAKGTPEAKKVAKRITTRTHLISLLPLIHRGYKEGKNTEELIEWLETFFFTTNRSTTVCEDYNEACRSNANSRMGVAIRNRELEISYEGFFLGKTEDEYLEEHGYNS